MANGDLIPDDFQEAAFLEEPGAVEEYQGDCATVDEYVKLGQSREEAIVEVQSSKFVLWTIRYVGLEYLLDDKYAVAALMKFLSEGNADVIKALFQYANRRRPKGKRGPRPKPDGYIGAQVVRLREQGLTFGQIAARLWNDPAKRSLASAHYSQEMKKRPKPAPKAG